MSKAERAINALRDAADAVDALPAVLRRTNSSGLVLVVSPAVLRGEADWIERVIEGVKNGLTE